MAIMASLGAPFRTTYRYLRPTKPVRISLGLEPQTEDKAPESDTDKQAEQNFTKYKEREAKDRDAKDVILPSVLHSIDISSLAFGLKRKAGDEPVRSSAKKQ